MTTSNNNTSSELLLELVKSYTNIGGKIEGGIEGLYSYCAKILGSRVSVPSGTTLDEVYISEQIQKQVFKEGGTPLVQQFNNLFLRLSQKNSLKNRWAILYVLQSLAQSNKAAKGLNLSWSTPLMSTTPTFTMAHKRSDVTIKSTASTDTSTLIKPQTLPANDQFSSILNLISN
jgi:hypothetical protein